MLIVLAALLGLLVGGGVCYSVMRSRDACDTAESAEHSAEEAADAGARHDLRLGALDRRLHACERAVDELCRMTNFGIKRKQSEGGDSANPG